LLHDLGNTWEDIAHPFGISRSTLYEHLDCAGRSSAWKEWTEISDEDLDERVAEISLLYSFSGSAIISGHLEARGVHVARKHVQDRLRRVDEIGVLVRYMLNHILWILYVLTILAGGRV
jgi:hypothetical protein